MGSIAAVLSRTEPPGHPQVERMLRAAPHRGTELKTVKLGSAVLGVSSGDGVGASAVVAEDGWAAAFSGDFDNLEELARELDEAGARALGPAGAPPCEARVLIRAFLTYGAEAPARIRGPFTGVVSDGRTLWSFRDAVGFRPLVYRDEPRGVWVATEVKQVVVGSGIGYRPNLEVMERIFHATVGKDSRCAVEGVEHVAQGHVLASDARSSRLLRYWRPEALLETARWDLDELQERFDALMTRAVDRCLHGDDVVSLSGGVDSPAVAAYGAPVHLERTGRPLSALSGFYPDFPSVDESDRIRLVAEALGMPLHSYEPRARATDGLLSWVRLLDGPVPVVSLAQTRESLEQAAGRGFRCMLTGEMAEFVFDASQGVQDHLLGRGRIGSALRLHRTSRERNGRNGDGAGSLAKRTLRSWVPDPAWMLYRRARPVPPRRTPPWIDAQRVPRPPVRSPRHQWRENQLMALHGSSLPLQADDFIQSVTGVKTRRPWTDLDLWALFLSLPAQVKHPEPGSKALVRRLLRGRVPDPILDRTKKTVFDEAIAKSIDYQELERWLVKPEHRVPGIRYELLAERLERRELNLVEFMRAKDLAAVHAFLSLC